MEPSHSKRAAAAPVASVWRKPEVSMQPRFASGGGNGGTGGSGSGRPTAMVFRVAVPAADASALAEARVRISGDKLYFAGGDYRLETELPFAAHPGAVRAFTPTDGASAEIVVVVPCAAA
jgi:hypothetical protein